MTPMSLFLNLAPLRTTVVIVRELMGRVRNVVLIKCTLDLGKPKRGWDFGREGAWAGGEMGELVYKQPGTEVDDSCHS